MIRDGRPLLPGPHREPAGQQHPGDQGDLLHRGWRIEEASAKVRAKGVADDDEDYELPIYAERIPVRTVLGAPEPCPRLLDGVTGRRRLNGYSEGRLLEDALRDAYFVEYPNG